MAYLKRLVCLAYSVKSGGYCVAGREILANGQYGGWIRPVSERPAAELSFMEALYQNNESPRLLDIIDVPLRHPHPHGHQRENHLIDSPAPWIKRGRLPKARLQELCERPSSLWINGEETKKGRNNCVSAKKAARLKNSLCLLHVPRFAVEVFDEPQADDTRLKYKGSFVYGGVGYCMTVTDPVVIDYLSHKGKGKYHFESVYLTISLTEPFSLDQRCHKLIAAVIRKSSA
jgi:hypothetical protein